MTAVKDTPVETTQPNETPGEAPKKAPPSTPPRATKPKRGFERGPGGVRQPLKHENNRRAPIGWRGGAR